MTRTLSIVGWDHPRCWRPLQAAATAWTSLTGDEVEVRYRSLEQFGDQPLHEVVEPCDLIFFDHPHVSGAAVDGALVALDELLPVEQLDRHAADAVGPSHAAYAYGGRQYGLAADAACQVTAYRPDRLESPPETWHDVTELARRVPGAVALPAHPTHLLCAYLTLCANAGGDWRDPAVGVVAVEILQELRGAVCGNGEPPALLHELTRKEGPLCLVPVVFGYVTYATARPEVEVPCKFTNLPSAGRGSVGGLLGGAGLGIPSGAAHHEAAAAFASWYCSSDVQTGIVAASGGQPGSRAAWCDDGVNAAVDGFYSDTIETMEHASLRPRDPSWPALQVACGAALADGLELGRPAAEIVASLAGGAEAR